MRFRGAAGVIGVLLIRRVAVSLGVLEGIFELGDAVLVLLLGAGGLGVIGQRVLVGILRLLELPLQVGFVDFCLVELLERVAQAAGEVLLLGLDALQLF